MLSPNLDAGVGDDGDPVRGVGLERVPEGLLAGMREVYEDAPLVAARDQLASDRAPSIQGRLRADSRCRRGRRWSGARA